MIRVQEAFNFHDENTIIHDSQNAFVKLTSHGRVLIESRSMIFSINFCLTSPSRLSFQYIFIPVFIFVLVAVKCERSHTLSKLSCALGRTTGWLHLHY